MARKYIDSSMRILVWVNVDAEGDSSPVHPAYPLLAHPESTPSSGPEIKSSQHCVLRHYRHEPCPSRCLLCCLRFAWRYDIAGQHDDGMNDDAQLLT
jgi:hypothetical protein